MRISATDVPDLRAEFVKKWQPGNGLFWSGTTTRVLNIHPHAQPADAVAVASLAAEGVRTGELFYVSPDLVPLLIHAARSLPGDTVITDFHLAAPAGFLVFGRPIAGWGPMEEDDVEGSALSWNSAEVSDQEVAGRAIQSVAYALHPGRTSLWLDCRMSTWLYGDPVVSNYARSRTSQLPEATDRVERDKRLIAALSLMLHQRIVVAEVAAMPRSVARRAERLNLPSDVRVMRLRQRVAPEDDDTVADQHSAVDWSHRWVVSGHWRSQPVGPQRAQRSLVWIAPYVKGPEDKPLVVKETVKALVR